MTSNSSQSDQATLERDVRETQDEIGETVQRLEQKLKPSEVAREAVGDRNFDVAKEALELAKHNPIPVALIAVGAIWLLATSKSPTIMDMRSRLTGKAEQK